MLIAGQMATCTRNQAEYNPSSCRGYTSSDGQVVQFEARLCLLVLLLDQKGTHVVLLWWSGVMFETNFQQLSVLSPTAAKHCKPPRQCLRRRGMLPALQTGASCLVLLVVLHMCAVAQWERLALPAAAVSDLGLLHLAGNDDVNNLRLHLANAAVDHPRLAFRIQDMVNGTYQF